MTAQPSLVATTDRGEKITLRPAADRDADALIIACTDPETLKWTTVPPGYDRERAQGFIDSYAPGWWERGDGACWVIADSNDDYVAQIDLRINGRDRQLGDVGFLTSPHARGKGYMTAALRAAARFGFEELGLIRIEWKAHVGNFGSRRVAEKAGFQIEGIQRLGVPHRDERFDNWLGAMIAQDLT